MITAILKNLPAGRQGLQRPHTQFSGCGVISLIFFLIFVIIILFVLRGIIAEEQTVIEYTSANLRDPFENLLAKGIEKSRMLAEQEGIGEEKAISEINLPQLSLQGLIWDAPIPQAIIDDKIVKIGDNLKEAEVLDIKKEGVTLLFQNKKFMIKPR